MTLRFMYNNLISSSDMIKASSLRTGNVTSALKDGTGSANMTPSGNFTGTQDLEYTVEIDSTSAGAEIGQATMRWSDGGGAWDATGQATSTAPTALNNGVSIAFTAGTGDDFILEDTWYFKAVNIYNKDKLLDLDRDSRYRSLSLESPNGITVDLSSAQEVKACIIYDHNLTTGAATTIKGNATDPDSIATAVYDSVSFSCSAQDSAIAAIFFDSTGTDMFIAGATNDQIYKYELSSAWQASSASYTSKAFDHSGQETNVKGLSFNSNGTKMFIGGLASNDILEYDLNEAWNPTSAAYSSSLSITSQCTTMAGFDFNEDGTILFVGDSADDSIHKWELSTAYAITSGTASSESLDLSTECSTISTIHVREDGHQIYAVDTTTDTIYQYDMLIKDDLDSGSYSANSFDVSSQETTPTGMFLRDDQSKLYIIGQANNDVFQYSVQNWANPDFEESITHASDKILHYLSSATTKRYWKLEITDTGNSDGYIEIGELYIGSYFEPAQNFMYGSGRRDITTLVSSNRSSYGVNKRRFFNTQRSFSYQLKYISDIEDYETMLNTIVDRTEQTIKAVFFNEDSATTADFWLVEFEKLPWRLSTNSLESSQLTMKEVVASV